jgi:hypothetical protein
VSLSDVKYIPGIVFAVVALVGVLGFVAVGAVAFFVTQPAALLVFPALGAVAWVYIKFDEAVHPDRVKYVPPIKQR